MVYGCSTRVSDGDLSVQYSRDQLLCFGSSSLAFRHEYSYKALGNACYCTSKYGGPIAVEQ